MRPPAPPEPPPARRVKVIERLRRLPVRAKLLALVLLPLALVLPLLGLLLGIWGNVAFDRLLVTKVQSDLAVARGYFERLLEEVGDSATTVADSHALHRALESGSAAAMQALLQDYKRREELDFIVLRDAAGRLIDSDAGIAAAERAPAPRGAAPGGGSATLSILAPDDPVLRDPALQARIAVPLIPTRNAAPTARLREDRALVVLAHAPVLDDAGQVVAQVQAGVLLNRNLGFIDHLNAIVYPAGALPFGSQGTATLFLGDVRISTNVRLFGGASAGRAIGTRVSQAVRDAVLGRGSTWLGSAFVVDDWYVSAYQPLLDGAGRRIGMLYVGFLERPFTWVKAGTLAAIGLLFFVVMLAAAQLSLRGARSIFRPIELMAQTMQRVGAGEPQARVGALGSGDEIGQLAGHLDHLLDAVDENTRALQRWNAELDARVAQRTRDLEAAQQQLLRSEKMAAVGQLTASIAHEVNNPIAVIQGNLDLVRELLEPAAAQTVRGELALIDEQIERMRLIVTQVLQFARPGEYAGYVEEVDIGPLLDGCMVLVAHLLSSARIEVERDLRARRRPWINRNELQQVLVNLLVNALHAMNQGGRLRLGSRDLDDGRVEIAVADTGPGLGPELLAELFKPFVTRKKDGTGLGLWISRSIVERYGGELLACDRDDFARGAVFTLRLRAEGGGGGAVG
ncbi:MAG: cache domain-containing protein [Burkholderiales bacterium]|nr:cache domain-containing protein [Burkholderiales bacterium]